MRVFVRVFLHEFLFAWKISWTIFLACFLVRIFLACFLVKVLVFFLACCLLFYKLHALLSIMETNSQVVTRFLTMVLQEKLNLKCNTFEDEKEKVETIYEKGRSSKLDQHRA